MSTRSTISVVTNSLLVNGIEEGVPVYKTIYCHFDGYPYEDTGVGNKLLKFYTDRKKVESLIAHGDLSVLEEKINPDNLHPHSFNNPQENVCLFYHRDQGLKEDCWENTRCKETNNRDEFEKITTQNYNYLFDNGKWYVKSGYLNSAWIELELENKGYLD